MLFKFNSLSRYFICLFSLSDSASRTTLGQVTIPATSLARAPDCPLFFVLLFLRCLSLSFLCPFVLVFYISLLEPLYSKDWLFQPYKLLVFVVLHHRKRDVAETSHFSRSSCCDLNSSTRVTRYWLWLNSLAVFLSLSRLKFAHVLHFDILFE